MNQLHCADETQRNAVLELFRTSLPAHVVHQSAKCRFRRSTQCGQSLGHPQMDPCGATWALHGSMAKVYQQRFIYHCILANGRPNLPCHRQRWMDIGTARSTRHEHAPTFRIERTRVKRTQKTLKDSCEGNIVLSGSKHLSKTIYGNPASINIRT